MENQPNYSFVPAAELPSQQGATLHPTTAEELAAMTGGHIVGEGDDWDAGQDIPSAWFKFAQVGDSIKGTLVGKRYQKSSNPQFKDQWIYELKTATGAISKVPMSVERTFITDKMKYVAYGQVVMFKYLKDVPSAKWKGKFAKSIDVKLFGLDPDYREEEAQDAEAEIDVAQASFD